MKNVDEKLKGNLKGDPQPEKGKDNLHRKKNKPVKPAKSHSSILIR